MMEHTSPFPVRAMLMAVWLGLAWWSTRRRVPRLVFSYLGSITGLVQLGATAGMFLQLWIKKPVFEGMVIPYIGITAGGIIGFLVALFCGYLAAKHLPLYWTAQFLAVGFLLFYPLTDW